MGKKFGAAGCFFLSIFLESGILVGHVVQGGGAVINFTVGPVQMDEATLKVASQQIPYFRTADFSQVVKDCEHDLLALADAPAGSRAVFLTSSGTGAMEAAVAGLFCSKDKVLVVNGGTFGERLVQLCTVHNIPCTQITLEAGQPILSEHLLPFEKQGYTGFLVQLCETSTGVLFDMTLIADFCRRNGIFLVVDAISGFLADKVSMQESGIGCLIAGSQKALSLPPGMAFLMLSQEAIQRCKSGWSVYFDLPNYLKDGERGQTPFTPAVATILMLHDRLRRIIEGGGAQAQQKKIGCVADYFRKSIKTLPLRIFTDEHCLSNCVTACCVKNGVGLTAYAIFESLARAGIWVCPNGGALRDKVFRVGHIGAISIDEIDKLVEALNMTLCKTVRGGGNLLINNKKKRVVFLQKEAA